MRLFIAEKPDLARVIAEALGSPRSKSGFIECNNGDVVTWCVGHLLALAGPELHNPDYKLWRAEDLPLKLRPAKYVAIPKTAGQLKTVGELIGKASQIVHAGDPDDEGQLLVEEVLEHFGNRSPVQRLLLNDMNANAARKAIDQMRDNKEFYGLYQKALARSIGDQIYGFNMTRAYTLAAQAKGYRGVLSMGRVQTVILWLIVNRYNLNRSHAAAFFYNLVAGVSIGTLSLKARYIPQDPAPIDEKGRVIDEAFAKVVVESCSQAAVQVESVNVEEKKTVAPLPFSLLDLQAEVSRLHGINAEKTLALTQSLRDNYKAITYNRSDCNYLTDEQFAEAPDTLMMLQKLLPEFAGVFAGIDPQRKSRAFNDSKVSAHTGIIPTGTSFDLSALSGDERKVYTAIVQRYLAQFLPDKQHLVVSVEFGSAGHKFLAKQAKVTHPGWTVAAAEVVDEDSDDGADEEPVGDESYEALAGLSVGQEGVCSGVAVTKEKTKPLPIYTESALLKDLRRVAKYVEDPRIKKLLQERDEGKAAGENGGIGTPATRAAMLTKLRERDFYVVDKKKFIPTPLGIEFISVLPSIATRPDMTALWHEQQLRIQAGEITVDQFLDELERFVAEQVQNVDVGNIRQKPAFDLNAKCPMCGGELASTTKVIGCRACSFQFWPVICGKQLTLPQLEALLTKGRTGLIKGFQGKSGTFDAAVRLDAEGATKFDFPKAKAKK